MVEWPYLLIYTKIIDQRVGVINIRSTHSELHRSVYPFVHRCPGSVLVLTGSLIPGTAHSEFFSNLLRFKFYCLCT